jgi:dihydroorotate dehydrogenase (NAD+) catalytic subunit
MIDLNGIPLRNRLVTSASLLGYGASPRRLILYGLSPIAQWVPLERFGAVTARTVTTQPREGHFTLREDWKLREYPELLRRYAGALRRVDAGWINAFGWSNIGIDRYLDEYYPRTHHLNRIVSLGGFSADEFCELVETVNRRVSAERIAAVEFNVSCHNVNFPFEDILDEVVGRAIPASRHPVIVKLSPDTDYVAAAKVAERNGAAAVTAINAVKALRLDPRTGEPLLRNRFGSLSLARRRRRLPPLRLPARGRRHRPHRGRHRQGCRHQRPGPGQRLPAPPPLPRAHHRLRTPPRRPAFGHHAEFLHRRGSVERWR